MAMRRRDLVKGGLLVAFGSVLPGATAGAEIVRTPRWMVRASMAGLLHTSFLVRRTGEPDVELLLTDVTGLGNNAREGERHFRARFTGNHGLRQGTYRIDHPALGSFDAFLVPVGRPEAVQAYEILVNRK